MTSLIPHSPPATSSRHSERGSALFLILVSVALFAALAAVVTASMRLTSGTAEAVGEEKMRLALNDIRTIAEGTRIAITTLVVSNGIPIDAIDASASDGAGIDYAPWANTDCTDDTCRLYKADGGGLTFYKFGVLHSGLTDIPGVVAGDPEKPVLVGWGYIEGKGSSSADVILMVRVNKAFCTFINKQIGVTADVDDPANVTPLLVAPMEAAYRVNNVWMAYLTSASAAPHLAGKSEGCYRRDTGEYRYFSLLYPT